MYWNEFWSWNKCQDETQPQYANIPSGKRIEFRIYNVQLNLGPNQGYWGAWRGVGWMDESLWRWLWFWYVSQTNSKKRLWANLLFIFLKFFASPIHLEEAGEEEEHEEQPEDDSATRCGWNGMVDQIPLRYKINIHLSRKKLICILVYS